MYLHHIRVVLSFYYAKIIKSLMLPTQYWIGNININISHRCRRVSPVAAQPQTHIPRHSIAAL
jgi:hypothetical protein